MRHPLENAEHAGQPNEWLERIFSGFLTGAEGNTLSDFPTAAIFGRPVMGVARGQDDIFGDFRSAVSPQHIQPVDFLRRQFPALDDGASIHVVSWALPFSREVVNSNGGGEWPSELYSVARNNGAALIHEALGRTVRALKSHGFAAAAPALTEEYDAFRSPDFTFSSTWSERHVAYAAGLGRFGLNGCLITSSGANVRLASLVTSLPLEVKLVKRDDYRASCLKDGGKSCGRCLERCPVRAISRSGLDKSKCYGRRQVIRRKFLSCYSQRFGLRPSPIVKSGRREPGFSLGCALCMAEVPCESGPFPEGTSPR